MSVHSNGHALACGRCPRMVESGQQAYELGHCSQDYEDMEDLMGGTPDIIFSGLEPLRYTCLIFQVSFPGWTPKSAESRKHTA